MANPGTAAQAVSAHTDSTQEGTALCVDTCRGLVFKAAVLKRLFSEKKSTNGNLFLLQPCLMCALYP